MHRLGLALLLGGFVACNGGGAGCTDCSGSSTVPYPNPPPPGGEIQAGVVHVRLTEHVLRFVRTHLPALLSSFFTIENHRAVYFLDETLFDAQSSPFFLRDACIGEPDEPCPPRDANPAAEQGPTYASKIAFDIDSLANELELTWLDANADGMPGIRFALVNFDLFVDIALVINLPDLTGVAACKIMDQEGRAAINIKELAFDLRLGIDNSGSAPVFVSRVENLDVKFDDAAGDSALNLEVAPCDGTDPACDDPRCYGAWGSFADSDCSGVCGLLNLFSRLGGFLTRVLMPIMLDELGPALAQAVSEALAGALANLPLGIETQIDIGEFAGPWLSGVEPLSVKAQAASNLEVNEISSIPGLDLSLDGGVASGESAACATGVDPPDLGALAGAPPEYSGFVEILEPSGGSHYEAYDLALGVSQALIAQVAWSAFQSGLLCLSLDSYAIEELTDGTMTLSAGLLMDLDARLVGLTDPASPLVVTLRASRPPAVRLGAGASIGGGIDDPLIELIFDDMELGIFMLLDGQVMRLTGIAADVVVRVGVSRNADSNIELVLDEIALADTRQFYNELAPSADLSRLLELIVDIALDELLGDNRLFEFDFTEVLSDALDAPVYLRLNALRRDLGPGGAAYLSVLATLCDGEDIEDDTNLACYSPGGVGRRSRVTPTLSVDETSLYQQADGQKYPVDRFMAAPSGRARLRVGGTHLRVDDYAYQLRVDGGMWSTWRLPDAGWIEIASPRLRIHGEHQIEVRAHKLGDYRQVSEPRSVDIRVDRERPLVFLSRVGDRVVIDTFDLGSPDAIELWARISTDEPWWETTPVIDVSGRRGTLEVKARDLAGNTSAIASLALGGNAVTVIEPPGNPDPASGCAAAPSIAATFAVFLMWQKRRRKPA